MIINQKTKTEFEVLQNHLNRPLDKLDEWLVLFTGSFADCIAFIDNKKKQNMNKREQIIELYPDEEIIFAEGFDDAIIGVNTLNMRVAYSVSKSIEIVKNQFNDVELEPKEIEEGLSLEDKKDQMAWEHFDFNVRGSVFEGCPIWIEDEFLNDCCIKNS